jgi:hypothetical protein
MSTRSISAIAVLALALVVAAMPAVAQTSATSDEGSARPAVVHNTWSLGTPIPTARMAASAGAIGNNIYVVGGLTANGAALGVNEIYNTKKNLWTTGLPTLPRAESLLLPWPTVSCTSSEVSTGVV